MDVLFSSKGRRLIGIVAGALLGAAALLSSPGVAQEVVLYENKNFEGRSKGLGVGEHRLTDFDSIASSIRVPNGLVAVLYEHSDDNGGYGVTVDLLEDRPDLAQVSFDNRVAYVSVFVGKDSRGFFWARNGIGSDGKFAPGHWQRAPAAGAPVNTTAVLSPPVPPSATPRRPGGFGEVRDHTVNATPASILETTYTNPRFDTSKPTWASDVVGGKSMFPDFGDTNIIPGTRLISSPDYAKNEWTQILNPDEDYEVDVVGASGRAILIMANPNSTGPNDKYKVDLGTNEGTSPADVGSSHGMSGADVPFTHPFGTDWEFYIVPDAPYQSLAAPPAPPPHTHLEYAASVSEAKRLFNLDVVNTLGVEIENRLVPAPYRVKTGDRVAVFGRWIVDTGHPDFHTEIHPPLLIAAAHATSDQETTTTVIGRPYLVSQRWPGGPGNLASLGMIDHLLEEADKVPYSSGRAEAHPIILPKAFTGVHAMSYTVRPPTARNSPSDRLIATFHFTVRSGVVVQVARAGDAVNVVVAMNGNVNTRGALTTRHDVVVDREALKKMDERAGQLYLGKEIERGGLSSGVGAALLAKGVKTDRYDAPVAHSVHDTEVVRVPVDSLAGNTPFTVDDGQPFPIYGQLTLTWERGH